MVEHQRGRSLNKLFTKLVGNLVLLLSLMPFADCLAEDGYELWLRYRPLSVERREQFAKTISTIVIGDRSSDTYQLAARELQRGLTGLLDKPLALDTVLTNNAVRLSVGSGSADLGEEGFKIERLKEGVKTFWQISANTDQGILYGTYAFLRRLQQDIALEDIPIQSSPKINRRVLNHWDNLNGTVERGYAGGSIWDWWQLPNYINPRYEHYARANASIGINGTVLNNVNAQAEIISDKYLAKVAAIADVFRPFGIRVYLSIKFNAPMLLAGMSTADPLDSTVIAWWQNRVDAIYQRVPDFGGFLVKANSEGQPGPQDFGRSHAEGANMLANLLKPYDGIVMWRAFVYSATDAEDRAKQAFNEFVPLDGRFAENVLVQVKNGPIDFQPREPFHPIFGAMPKTPLMLELQITKEYLGFATHLAYLAPMYQEVLQADTFAKGQGSSVLKVVDGSLDQHALSGIAGVANIGRDRNWSGSIFNQANWYAFGRLAWNPAMDNQSIAREWLAQTFDGDAVFNEQVTKIMLDSREAVVNYMTPLGLSHLMATGHHYGPGPWVDDLDRPEWNPTYYHQADKQGVGFDRTATGSNALSQYHEAVQQQWQKVDDIDEKYLLWFHHVDWQFVMANGNSLWENLIAKYDQGLASVLAWRRQWKTLMIQVDSERGEQIQDFLQIQGQEAKWWRDASIAYFQSVSGLPLPSGVVPPEHSLEYYKSLSFPDAPGHH
jgi:alpha-glucuronidase